MNFLLRGYYGQKNVGDNALLYSILIKLNEVYPSGKFSVISKNPMYIPNTANNVYFVISTIRNVLSELFKCDCLLFGGGGQFQNTNKKRLPPDLIKQLALIILAKILGKKVGLLGVSIGPVYTKLDELVLKYIVNFSDAVSIRDNSSINLLRNLGIKRDLILTFDIGSALATKILVPAYKISKDKLIGLSVLPVFFNRENNYQKDLILIENLAKNFALINKENNINFNIRLFVFHNGEKGDKSLTIQFRDMLQKRLGQNCEIEVIPYDDNPLLILEKIKECHCFIGMRLHSCIFAYLSELPLLAVNYHPKIKGFAEMVELPSQSLIELEDIIQDDKKFKEIFVGFLLNTSGFKAIKKIEEIKKTQNDGFARFIKRLEDLGDM